MKYCNSYAFGYIIGGLSSVLYVSGAVIAIKVAIQTDSGDVAAFIIISLLCLLMTVLSVLLIMGIKKRRHKLVLPWIQVNSFVYMFIAIRLMMALMFVRISDHPVARIAVIIIVCLITIVLPALIFWFMFNLYKDIRQQDIENKSRLLEGNDIENRNSNNQNRQQSINNLRPVIQSLVI